MSESIQHFDDSAMQTIGFGGTRARDLYTQDLRMDEFRRLIQEPSYALQQDPDAWVKMRRDAVIRMCMTTRFKRVASAGFRVLPITDADDDKFAASIVEQALALIPNFWMTRFNLAKADMRGTSYSLMTGNVCNWSPVVGDTADGSLRKDTPKPWWMFKGMHDVDRYRFRIQNTSSGREVMFYSVNDMSWQVLENPEWFIRHVHEDTEYGRGYGEGLMDPVYFMWYAKMVCLEKGLQGLDAWANGRAEVGVDGTIDASTGKTNQNIVERWRSEVRHWLETNVMVHAKEDEVKFHDGPSTGHQMVTGFLHYCDNSICRLMLGSDLPFGGGESAGSFARAETEADTSVEYLQPSRGNLSETLTSSIIPLWWERNFPNLQAMGLGNANKPKIELFVEPAKNRKENAEVISAALSAGIPLMESEVYDALDFTPPGPDDRVIEGRSAPQGGGLSDILGNFNQG